MAKAWRQGRASTPANTRAPEEPEGGGSQATESGVGGVAGQYGYSEAEWKRAARVEMLRAEGNRHGRPAVRPTSRWALKQDFETTMARKKGRTVCLQLGCIFLLWGLMMAFILAPLFAGTRFYSKSRSWETLLKNRQPGRPYLPIQRVSPFATVTGVTYQKANAEIEAKLRAAAAERRNGSVIERSPELDLFFDHLKDSQTVRAGDTLALDFRCVGLSNLSPLAWRQLSFAIVVNGTAWDERKGQINADVASGQKPLQFIVDLPLGQHSVKIEFWNQGGPTGLASKSYNVTSRRTDRNEPWDGAKDECMVSLLCRSLFEFDDVMRKEGYTYFLTYYTLLGMNVWGWFTPWRGVHRYDAGVQGNHIKFLNHKTPWKNTIFVGMYFDEYDNALDLSLTRTKRWTAESRGTKATGYTITFTHSSLLIKVVMYLFEREIGPGSQKVTWHASTVDDDFGKIFHEDFGIRDFELFDGVFRVPSDSEQYLQNEFGLGWRVLAANLIFESTTPDTGLDIVKVDEDELKRKYPMCGEIPTTNAKSEKKIVGGRVVSEPLKDKWKVALCTKHYDEAREAAPGSGLVLVRRLQGCNADWTGFLSEHDKDIAQEAHDLFGPDEIFVDLEGPELHSLTQQHLGNCRYAFEYDTRLPGMYFLKISHYREEYSALQEHDHLYQRPMFDDLIGDIVPVVFGLTGEARGTALTASRDPSLAAVHAPPAEGDATCDTLHGATAKGRWVALPPTEANKNIFEARPSIFCPLCEIRKPPHRACGTGRVWLTDPKTYDFVPFDCKYKRIEGGELAKSLSNKRILFSGDSHMRTFYNAFMNQACGVSFAAQKGHATSQCHTPNASSPCAGSKLCLEHNYLGWVDATLNPDWWDVVLANFGQHPSCGAHHWTQREFRKWFDNYMEVILQRLRAEKDGLPSRNVPRAKEGSGRELDQRSTHSEPGSFWEMPNLWNSEKEQKSLDGAGQGSRKAKGGRGMKFIWVATNAMPITRDKMMAQAQDWRTNQRLRMYELYAEKHVAFLQKNATFLYPGQLQYMDSFSPSLPLVEAAAGDCGHFSSPNYQMISVRQLLSLLSS
mmetsp:Transcript_35259/g.86698  ORF Transcript_35259/g.86698 Transcript_35259/m.86698 type:complete len:1073 (-) Transcript_35259:188-3406(-)